MGFLSVIPVVGELLSKGLDIIDQNVADKDLANKLKSKFDILEVESNIKLKEMELENAKSQRELTGTVIKSHVVPVKQIYYIYLFLVVFNYVFAPLAKSFGLEVPSLSLPEQFTSIVNTMTYAFFGYHGAKKVIGKKKQ